MGLFPPFQWFQSMELVVIIMIIEYFHCLHPFSSFYPHHWCSRLKVWKTCFSVLLEYALEICGFKKIKVLIGLQSADYFLQSCMCIQQDSFEWYINQILNGFTTVHSHCVIIPVVQILNCRIMKQPKVQMPQIEVITYSTVTKLLKRGKRKVYLSKDR